MWVKVPRGTKADAEKAKERLQHFRLNSHKRQTNDDQILDADCFIPYPDEYKEKDKKAHAEQDKIDHMTPKKRQAYVTKHGYPKNGFNSGGYDWCHMNWGTKWGFCEVSMVDKGNELVYAFQTAWSPPEPLIKKMAEMYPELKFVLKYYEAGSGYKGELVCEKGEVIKEETSDYKGRRGG